MKFKNRQQNMENTYVIGLDFGTDSVRALLVDVLTGEEVAVSVFEYPRWKQGLYCIASDNQFRQHPSDYIEGLEYVIRDLLLRKPGINDKIKAIALDTTGSTPCLINKDGIPLALMEKHRDNPNAMFVLWKDHTALREAAEINTLSAGWAVDYTKYLGRNYSSEWFWAKALHLLRTDRSIREDAYCIMEHCDWIPALLIGNTVPEQIKLSRCSAGHKAMWAEEWDGFPPREFFSKLDSLLDGFVERLNPETYTCDQPAGYLCKEWAERFGLNTDILIGIGNTDAHSGAVGAGVRYKTLVQNLGTSTCNMAVMPEEKVNDNLIEGISGQVDGSIIPGMIGFEAGMSAFGDVYAWFKKMILRPVCEIIGESSLVNEDIKRELIHEISEKMLFQLTKEAEQIVLKEDLLFATDWLNGRRNPYINYSLKGTIAELTLSTGAADIFRALVEATAFGTKAIIDHFIDNGIEIEDIIGTGGIAQKSPFIMQVLSDVLNMPIRVSDTKQAAALGSAMFAATIAGFYPNVEAAQAIIMKKTNISYYPDPEKHRIYSKRYERYKHFGKGLDFLN